MMRFCLFRTSLRGLAVVILIGGTLSLAQNAGNNTVYNGATATPSAAFIDASVFPPAGQGTPDICSALHYVLTNVAIQGSVIDARSFAKISSTQTTLDCTLASTSPNPFIGVMIGSTILLPPGNILINATWTIPGNTRLIGEGSFGTTAINWNSGTAPTSGFMVQMCLSPCTNASMEHLTLTLATGISVTLPVSGIENVSAGDGSYIDDITMATLYNGLRVDSTAANSGPYTNLNITLQNGTSTCSTGTASSCRSGIELDAPTRGVHGATIIGNTVLSGAGASGCQPNPRGNGSDAVPGAVLVRAGGNTVEDIHVETFWDGVQIEPLATSSSYIGVSGVYVSNISGGQKPLGPVTNTVHICGPNQASNIFGPCSISGATGVGTVSDISIWNASSDLDGAGAAGGCNTTGYASAITDDVQGLIIPYIGSGSNPPKMTYPMYHLGEAVTVTGSVTGRTFLGGGVVPASSTPTHNGIPAWTVGMGTPGATCPAIGSLYSNSTGTSSSSALYLCTTVGWTAVALTTYP